MERHWDGIAAHCDPRNKVSLGFVEGFNNKIRVIQRRAYGLRDQEFGTDGFLSLAMAGVGAGEGVPARGSDRRSSKPQLGRWNPSARHRWVTERTASIEAVRNQKTKLQVRIKPFECRLSP